MIQRLQSVFLLIIAVVLTVAIFQSVWNNKGVYNNTNQEGFIRITALETVFTPTSGDGAALSDEPQPPASPNGITSIEAHPYLAGLLGVSSLLALFTIFQYKKRLLQVRLCSFNYLLLSGTLLAYYLTIKHANGLLSNGGEGNFLFSFYAPVIAIIFNFLAIRFIRKDEALVRSVDRLR